MRIYRVILFVYLLGFPSIADARELCRELIVSAPPEYPPFSYTNETGLHGAGVEIVKAIAAKLGISVRIFSNASWARVYRAHLGGDIDLVAALYSTPAREKDLVFIGTYASERTVLVAPKVKPVRYHQWSDLIPLTGAVVNGDSRGKMLDDFIETQLRVVKVHSFVNVESLLRAMRVDYALVGEFSPKVTAFDYRSSESPLYAEEKALTEQPVYISLSKASKCITRSHEMKEAFNAIVTEEYGQRLLQVHSEIASGKAIRKN